MFPLLKKTVGEAKWLLVACVIGLYAFCCMRVWLVSYVEMSRFASIIAQIWTDFERFAPVPLEQLLTYTGRIAVGFEEFIVILLVSVWAISRASDCVSGEIDRGTMEMLLAQPVSRLRILWTHSLVTLLGIIVLVAVAWAGVFTGIHMFTVLEEPPAPTLNIPLTSIEIPLPGSPRPPVRVPLSDKVDWRIFWPAVLNLFALGFFLAGITTFLSSLDRYRWRTIGITIGFYVLQIAFKIIGRGFEPLRCLKYLSFFTTFEPQAAVYVAVHHREHLWDFALVDDQGRWIDLAPMGASLVLIGIGLCGYALATFIFCRRDLPAPL